MEFRFTEDQELFRSAVRGQLERAFGSLSLGNLLDDAPAHRRALWTTAVEQGWLALMAPADADGLGLGAIDSVLLHEELGRIIPAGPMSSNVGLLAGLSRNGILTEQIAALLPGIIGGTQIVSLAEPAPATLAGQALVEFPDLGTHFLYLDAEPQGSEVRLRIALVERADAGNLETHDAFDLSRPLAVMNTPELHTLTIPAIRWNGALGAARIAQCAELIGIAARSLERTIAYTREREQFGKPVGSFQAVKHKLANAFVELENAKTATYYAAWAWDNDIDGAALSIDIARACAGQMGWRVVADCIQAHGGMGFTWEAGLHVGLRRARRLAASLGTVAEARSAIAAEILAA